MTQRARARFTRATRFGIVAFTAAVLMLMNGDRPAGQIATSINAIDFLGTTAANQYITFGPATGPNGLNATDFTLELWFKKEGAGVTTTTSAAGGGGLSGGAVPLVAKGRGEGDGSNIDMNYFLGLSLSAGVYTLAADFEDTAAGINHAVTSTQAITDNTWYHAAATYNSATGVFTLYLNGVALPGSITVPALPAGTRIPRSDNIQHASIGSALTSNGTAGGFFNGVVDEVRIWNVARTQAQIAANMNLEVAPSPELIGRWGFNEGAGGVAFNSALNSDGSRRPHGTLTGTTAPLRIVGGFGADAALPPAPQNVAAHVGNSATTISWPDYSAFDLSGYNVYRNGSLTPLNVGVLTRSIFTDNTVTNGTQYSYTARAIDSAGNLSPLSTPVIATPNALTGAGIQFNGTNQYITFGAAAGTSELGVQTFTLETWFRRTGFGVGTSTGGSGFENATTGLSIPLITKGRAQADGSNLDTNYHLGINDRTGVLIVDFEDSATGLNHPASGTTPIPISTTDWHHAAATFDGTNIRLYLNGNLESTTSAAGFIPRSDSIQHAAIGTAMMSTAGSAAGFFAGLMDEVRIWNVARSQAQIQATMFQEVNPATVTGLIGRWALNEASGPTAVGSARSINGTLTPAATPPTWTAGYPFPLQTDVPAAPEGLFAQPGNARVTLLWAPNSETDLAGYNVYRSTSSPVPTTGTPVNGSTPVTSPSYVDLGRTNGTQYFYVVTAVDIYGNRSLLPSNEANATPLAGLNQVPVVTAGPDRTIDFSGAATLSGFVIDDGSVNTLWTLVGGPGVVNFASATSMSTTATFTVPGTYVLRLTANDGEHSAFDEMTVSVNVTLVGAGDIAPQCAPHGTAPLTPAEAVATLLDGIPGTVFTLGDNAYQNGTAGEFADCYNPTWGRHKSRTRPVTGNHDYNTPNATPYYDYFNGTGAQDGPAGDRAKGYYSYNLGNWHIVVLNSECGSGLWNNNGCAEGAAQELWLRADLAASPTNNIIAMWHRPPYSSSSDDDEHAYVQPLWQALYEYGVDISLAGHWHNYERLSPMNALGQVDTAFGIKTFVIGTGGINLSGPYPNVLPRSELRNSQTHGVVKFTLKDTSYDWQFIPITGQSFTDSGTGAVHDAPGNQPPVVNAGVDQTIGTGAAELNGSVTDDGSNTATWSQVSGPAAAVFGNTSALTTSVGFPTAGTYVLQLTVNDGKFVRSDTISVIVTTASGNLPPIVNAGPDQSIAVPNGVSLVGVVNDTVVPGTVTSTWTNRTPAVGTVTFANASAATTTATFSVTGTYILRLTANDGELSGFDELVVNVNPPEPNGAIDFAGTNAYVTFGQAPGLGLSIFTLEAWIRRDGAGTATSTGSGGITAIPIVTKGMAQEDTPANLNMNYFLGIRSSDGMLAADFEDTNGGDNHPVVGVTPIPADGIWHHVAATYNGTAWRLYLDGALQIEDQVGATPESNSTQHAAIGSALQSTATGVPSGQTQGFFNGAIDEVRIWNRALTHAEIANNINQQILNAPNLVARWGLNEAAGSTAVNDSTPDPINGVIIGTVGTAWTRTAGAPFNLVVNLPPAMPILDTPANGATGQTTAPNLSVTVSDPENQPLDVTFYGRATNAAPPPDFNYVAIPDTQHYSDSVVNAPTFTQQTQWIVANRGPMNIAFVSHLGDIVENIDGVPEEWVRADGSMDVLDAAVPPVPYGIAPGNHDMNSAGVAAGYNTYFGLDRMLDYPWYGGYLGQNQFTPPDPIDRQNYNQYSLFTAGGMDFVVIHLEYDMPTYAVQWADKVLKAYPNRRAVIATHAFLSDSGQLPTTVLNRPVNATLASGNPAQTVWNTLIAPNCNVFLVLNGHYPGEANATDLNDCGKPVHMLESDYQSRVNGGDGWLRYMTFKPSENKIYVYTYSPKLLAFEDDGDSEFVLDYDMGAPFTEIGTDTGVSSGTSAQVLWPGRAANTEYQWYATVSDGNITVTGPTWSFTTGATSTAAGIATQPQSQTIGSGTSASLSVGATGTAPLTYQWYQGSAPDTSNLVGSNSPNFTTPALTTQTSYWVRVSNAFGPAVNSATATISIGAAAAIGTQPQSQTIASGATANLSVGATGTNLTYQWYRGTAPDTTNLVGSNSPNFTTPNLTTQTSYWVRVSNAFGPSVDSATATISIGVAAAIGTQPQSQTIASGTTANLSVGATGTNLSYQWYRGTAPDTSNAVGTDSANFTTPNLTTQTSYWVRVSNAFGPAVNSATATISIGAAAAIGTPPQSQTITTNTTANLSVGATGTNLSYQWYQGTAPETTTLVGSNSPNFTTPNLTTQTSYWVRVSNAFGPSVDSATATISIGVAAAIGTEPQSQTIASNTAANLSVGATGTNLSYQWYRGTAPDTTNLVGSNSPNFTTPNLTTQTSYWVRVGNAFGPSVNSATATISIGVGAAIGTHPQSQTIASGTTANLSVAATGENLSYQWYQGTSGTTTTAVGTNSPNFTTPNLSVTTSYWVRVSNSFGSADSATATISIGVAAAIGTQPQSQTIASGATANLSVGTTGGNLNYQWYQSTAPDTTTLVGSNSANFTTPNLTTETSYWVRVSNAFGPSVDSATATISIGVAAAIGTQPQSQTIASNTTANLSVGATGTNLTYQWYRGTAPDTTTLVGSNSPNFTTPNLTTQTSYWVRISNAFGPSVNSATATISIGVAAAIGTHPQSQTIASGATANLSVGVTGTNLSYQWYQGTAPDTTTLVGSNSANFTTPNLTTPTSYWVRVSNAFGPSVNSTTATISIGVGAAIGTSPLSQTIASNTTVTLSVAATGTAPLTYQWYRGTAPDTTNSVGSNSASFITPALTTATSYWVRVSNAYGTADSATAIISIGVGAGVTTPPQSQTIASGTTAVLSVDATGANLSYQWYQGTSGTTTNPVGINSPSFTTPPLTTTASYWVRVSNTFGAVNSATATISIGVGAAITTSPQNQTIASGATANLSVLATGTAPLVYQWFQGTAPDVSTPVGSNSASFTTPALATQTSYWVRVSNTYGTADSTTATISIGVGAAIVTSPQSQTIASNTTATLSVAATGTNLSYQWYRGTAPDTTNSVGTNSATFITPALTAQTSYWVRVSNAFGPSVDSATATISIGVVAAIGTQPQSQTIVSGTAAALSVGATGTAPLAYQWYQGASGSTTTPMAGATTANFTTPNLTTTTSYWVRVSNAFGGVNSGTATISIGVGPGITTQPQSQTIASNTTALLTVGASGANLSYQWYQGTAPDQTNPVGTNSTSFTTPPLTAQTSYWVRVSNNFGGVSSNTATISMGAPVAFTPLGVGTHFPTIDNADQGAGPGPRAITPPAVQLGDLVVIVASYRGTATLTMAQTGGQLWTSEANTQANGQTVRVFWTQFNGIWTGNPAVTNTTGTLPLTAYSFGVDMAPGTYPEIDVPFLSGNHTGGTVTVPAFNIGTAGALALVGWISSDNNTWGAPTAGWSTPGGQAQWRNSNGSDNTIAVAHRIITSAGTTGTIARSQTLNGPDSGLYFRMAFKATTLTPATAPGAPLNLQAAASLGQVALTWADNSTNEFAFQIERCVNVSAACTNFAPLAAVGSNTTSYNDTTVANSTTYRYQVRAVNVLGPSQYSDIADATTPTPQFTFRAVGSHFPTVENADQGGGPGPRAITPPASLQPGDLMVIVAAYRGTATLALSETGGQVWTSETNAQANGQTVRVFWSQFNGFWTANPAVTNTTGTLPLTVYGLAFDMAPGLYPVIDVPFVSGSHAGGTVTVPSFDTNTTGVLALAGWISGDNNTWGAATTGWSTPGGQAQWRNSNGSDSSVALAYRLLGPAGPSGTIVRTQSASGPDTGIYFRLGFRALEVPSDPPADPSDLVATPSVGRVALTWLDHATNEAGFNIERCAGVNCTNFAPLTVVGPNAAAYNDTTVAANTTYRYQVRAFNLFSPSNYSNIADALTPAPPPPPPVPFTFRAVGTHYPTVDNTNGVGPGPRAVTPPATLQAGDLYVIVAAYRGNTTLSIAGTGGQTWTAEGNTQANGVSARVFWTRFNGTWAGTPSVTNTTGTEALTVYSFAFAMSAGMHPEIDVPVFSAGHSGDSVTVPSFATNTAGTLVLAGWLSNENNTWSAPTTGWSVPGSQQWRNTQGEDTSLALAYRVFTAAGPTGSVARTESDDDPGLYFRLAWKQVPN